MKNESVGLDERIKAIYYKFFQIDNEFKYLKTLYEQQSKIGKDETKFEFLYELVSDQLVIQLNILFEADGKHSLEKLANIIYNGKFGNEINCLIYEGKRLIDEKGFKDARDKYIAHLDMNDKNISISHLYFEQIITIAQTIFNKLKVEKDSNLEYDYYKNYLVDFIDEKQELNELKVGLLKDLNKRR
jgi:hypothetical protein